MWEGGLIAVCQQTRQEAEMQLQMGGIWTPSLVTPGKGRTVTLALLCEAATRHAAKVPNPIPHHRRRRGRGLGFPLHSCPSYPTLEPVIIGMGRSRSRNSGPCPYLCRSLTWGPDVYADRGIFPIPTWT